MSLSENEDVAEALVPARIINEHVYCPRLAWFEWEARTFVENDYTAEGSYQHRNVDQPRGTLARGRPAVESINDDDEPFQEVTSVTIASSELGVVAKLDKVEMSGGIAIPVETKRGRPRENSDSPVWEPDQTQLTVQALLLREAGFSVDHAEVYFAQTHSRYRVELLESAEARVRHLVAEIRANARRTTPPPALVNSPKCPNCSLVSVCMPDESNLLAARTEKRPRRLLANDSAAEPLYVLTPNCSIKKRGGRLELFEDAQRVADRRLLDISQVALFGNASISSGAMRACLDADIPVVWLTFGGWYVGHAIANGGSWVQRRMAQYRIAEGDNMDFRRPFVIGKIKNQRTLLRRNASGDVDEILEILNRLARRAGKSDSVEELMGVEGAAARSYFEAFPLMLKHSADTFHFAGRNRRPATNPVNAVLSFVYALLVRETTLALITAGLDPQVGFMHQPRFGRPSLGLDLLEEFRPLVGDSTVLMLFNNGELKPSDFVARGNATSLTKNGRRAVIDAYERRMHQELTHPIFKYKLSYRRAVELQARLLAATVEGQYETYSSLVTR